MLQAWERFFLTCAFIGIVTAASVNEVFTDKPAVIVGIRLGHVHLDVTHIVGQRWRVVDTESDMGVWQSPMLKLHDAKIIRTPAVPLFDRGEKAPQFKFEHSRDQYSMPPAWLPGKHR